MSNQYGVVDIFAGPGGLAEGFSRAMVDDHAPFKVELSIENEPSAHRTLKLRSFIHQFENELPQFYLDILNAGRIPHEAELVDLEHDRWAKAGEIAQQLTLASETQAETERHLDRVMGVHDTNTVLIGGPPCQVYSLAGRSRNRNNKDFHLDKRHRLYEQYIHILNYLRPVAFVMENVKGMLSSKLESDYIFPLVREDLESSGQEYGGYRLLTVSGACQHKQGILPPLTDQSATPDHREFVVRSEEYGVPQKRHRIIIIGIRKDIADRLPTRVFEQGLLPNQREKIETVGGVLRDMPLLRSGLSREPDSDMAWTEAIRDSLETLDTLNLEAPFRNRLREVRKRFDDVDGQHVRQGKARRSPCERASTDLMSWLSPQGLNVLPNNETRGHIREDLTRYMFASIWAAVYDVSPKATDFPDELAPQHRNWRSGHFADRFRVQKSNDASTTVTSHISKDGHYYIHPDPVQCRSLTVREAARLQTFPDDYVLMGNRTEQYVQVGNAVPPYLAKQIAERLGALLARSSSAISRQSFL